ncbi:Protein of unknown function [Modicisalibacter ilicicola DSM 19980]|uniref:DUF3429 domain-containing protein n=1 Tax=Modicisalibacter ilicicola DSM 19980 TaxID=1121942 RepID=A0A1M4UHI7_9GAMM|nr:DUF3429 domain-containing protein [Halomonas ilicicola]SHE56020.1 Protein of unknown function [Halomonas ilicicola DSM 19980]
MFAIGPPRLPFLLGIAGLVPFLAGAIIVFVAPVLWQALAIKAFIFYSAVILSFLGGIHWGVAMGQEVSDTRGFKDRLLLSMVPSLLAWPALLLDYDDAALVLMIGFLLVRLYERQRSVAASLPAWYQRLRSLLTAIVVLCHLAVLARLTLMN